MFCMLGMMAMAAAISSSAFPGFNSGLTNIAKHWFLIFNFITKAGCGLRVEGILMPHLDKAQSLVAIFAETLK